MKPLRRADLDDFMECYRSGEHHRRKPTWSPEKEGGRWRAFEYDELAKRDKLNLDLLWLRDRALEDSESWPGTGSAGRRDRGGSARRTASVSSRRRGA